ncbi:TetR family transcriptional regulator [Massilia eurypsychrophila]|jgi:AcrR family transcriptional regulator|uniref:TetR family transcriptional regulator n=1 Tax=Massilia eurypsychrophila TaxID=1485217 RepID=A0A2G8TFZ3_9BURK|nr:TetR/AcrR family transcriptional regulator [Massilia eurypsychrophila]PIL44859.1 TetR family transcriptional regulator [Massilia eurypsychrophila]
MDTVNLYANIPTVNMKTATSPRHSYHHGNLREELLRCAFDMLESDGADAITIRAVARAAGVAHSAPVNHFPSKQALLTSLAASIFHALAEEITNALRTGTMKYPEVIRTFANTVTEYALAHPNRYRLLWRRDLLDDHELSAAMDRIYGLLIEKLGKDERVRTTSLETRAIALWSMVHGYVTMRLDGNFVEKNDEINGLPRQTAIVEAILEGL